MVLASLLKRFILLNWIDIYRMAPNFIHLKRKKKEKLLVWVKSYFRISSFYYHLIEIRYEKPYLSKYISSYFISRCYRFFKSSVLHLYRLAGLQTKKCQHQFPTSCTL